MTTLYDENKKASAWLLHYHERLQQYKEALATFSEIAATTYMGMPHAHGVGKPTERKGTTLAELEERKRWIMTVEDAEKTLSEKKRVFLELRRQAVNMEFAQVQGRPGWVDYVQARYSEWHERRYGKALMPSRRQLFRWWSEIVDVTARIAIRRGCL